MRVLLTGYVGYNGDRFGPGEIIEVSEVDAQHIEKSCAGQILSEATKEEKDDVNTPQPKEVIVDGPNSGKQLLSNETEQPGVGQRQPDGQGKGAGHRRKKS